jgi:type II secretion system protein N
VIERLLRFAQSLAQTRPGRFAAEYFGRYGKYADLVGYPLFYVWFLAICLSLLFPYTKLKQHVVESFNAQQRATAGQQELQIDQMTGYWLSGVRLTGVRLFLASSEPDQSLEKIEIEEATVRYGILSSIFGGGDMTFDVHGFDGEASGSYETHGKDQTIEVTLESIDIGRVEPLVRALGVPLQGKLNGTVKLTMPEGKGSKGNGSVSLEFKDVVVGDGKAKIKGALALPPIRVGTITLAGEAKDGSLKISKLVAAGRDLDLQGEGRISMRELAMDSLCDVVVRFRLNDAYRAQNDITKTLFGVPGSSAPPLVEVVDPRVKQSKRADGAYAWAIRGPLGRPDLVPAAGP